MLIPDWDNNELRALLPLGAFPDRFLFVTREVDGAILDLLDETLIYPQQQQSQSSSTLPL